MHKSISVYLFGHFTFIARALTCFLALKTNLLFHVVGFMMFHFPNQCVGGGSNMKNRQTFSGHPLTGALEMVHNGQAEIS